MRWFGRESWGAPVCDGEHAPTPAGTACAYCLRVVTAEDRGVLVPHLETRRAVTELPWHLRCFLKSVGVEVEGVD